MNLNDRVVEVIKERVELEIGEDGVLDADELQEVELVISLEEEFGFKIPDDDHHRLRSVKGIMEYISSIKPEYSEQGEKS